MRLVAYTRVSTRGQVTDGQGLDVQEYDIRAWARTQGHSIVQVLSDNVSGTVAVEDRPGLTEAIQAVEDGQADGIVVKHLDRFARMVTVQEAALAMAWKAGGRVFTIAGEVEQDDPEDPMRTAMREMMAVFARLERGMIAARMRAGRRLKGERGGYAFGSPPFGWHSVDRKLAPQRQEQRGRRRIMELHREGKSLRQIIANLDAEGLTPKRPGARWHPSTVQRVIQRAGETSA